VISARRLIFFTDSPIEVGSEDLDKLPPVQARSTDSQHNLTPNHQQRQAVSGSRIYPYAVLITATIVTIITRTRTRTMDKRIISRANLGTLHRVQH
jgi:hypothetical protein